MDNMGEIDTKPIDSVQAAISLFGAKNDQKKLKHASSNGDEKERELEEVIKDLANCKVQLEAKDSANLQALLKLEQQQKAVDELSTLLKCAEMDRDKYINECGEVRVQLEDLELKLNQTCIIQDQLSGALSELKIREAELLSIKMKLAATRESELKYIVRMEMLENTAQLEKEKTVDLSSHISDLNETIHTLKFAAFETEKEMSAALSDKDAELKFATEKLVNVQKQSEKLSEEMEMMHDLEYQLLAKTLYSDMLELAITQTNNELSHEKVSSDYGNILKQLTAESSDQALYIESLEVELNRLKLEIEKANEEFGNFKGESEIETLTNHLESIKQLEMDEIQESENVAQVEIASLLKSKLNNGKSKASDAEVVESGGKNVEYPQSDRDSKTDVSERTDEITTITITLEEYQSLIKIDDQNSPTTTGADELEKMKRELEAAKIRVGEFRTRAEQATTRAEMAEKAKEAIEDQMKKWRDHRQKRKAAHAAMKEVSASAPRQFNPHGYDRNPTIYQPLGQVLNIKL